MELEKAKMVAEGLKTLLESSCDRPPVIVGSVRRRKPQVGDIELLCIPRHFAGVDMLDAKIKTLIQLGVLDYRRNKLGSRVYGLKNKFLRHVESGIGIDIFSTTEECWPVALVVRTGGKTTNKRIATAALRKGYRFRAYGDGFDTPNGHIPCQTEREVFEAVNLPYLEPWERE